MIQTLLFLATSNQERAQSSYKRTSVQKLHTYLTDRGLQPQLQRLDNEVSTTLKRTMKKLQVKYQLVPQYSHRRNPA